MKNFKKNQYIFTVLTTALTLGLWQNCSQPIGFNGSEESQLVTKLDDPITPSPDPVTVPDPSESAPPESEEVDVSKEDSDPSNQNCYENAKDVLLNIKSVSFERISEECRDHRDKVITVKLPDNSSGVVSLQSLVKEGIKILPSASATTTAVLHVALNSEGNSIVLEDDSLVPLRLLPSQVDPGFKILLGPEKIRVIKEEPLHLGLIKVPRLKKSELGCRMDRVWKGHLLKK
ncbi:MAG: hypothetical protein K1X29_06710 [Bdellovibrionales bacterium]|nr:hypothetical protein [Bdellovibrionales bacterium]